MLTQDALLLERIFSPTVFADLAKRERSDLFSKVVSSEAYRDIFDVDSTVGTAFDEAFSLLAHPGIRNEYIYKNTIAEKILLGRHSLNTAVLVQEMRALRSKADTVIFNGTSTAYEIKSDRDSLARLPLQVEDYRKVFAKVVVVADAKHLTTLEEILPADVGILELTQKRTLSTIRPAEQNLDTLEKSAMFDALKLAELQAMLTDLGCNTPEAPNTRQRRIYSEILSHFSVEQLHSSMVKTVKNSRSQAPMSDYLSLMPRSLYAAALRTHPSAVQKDHILKAIRTPLYEAVSWS
ncbi:sce7726 family protein [Rothia terrae]|uniref:sce7726 family protein n=1 Tax=Rothia terrae TaxID=396015 RepID=UPI0033F56ECA